MIKNNEQNQIMKSTVLKSNIIAQGLTISSSKSSFNEGPKYGGEFPVGAP
jgi:hypothetical protein